MRNVAGTNLHRPERRRSTCSLIQSLSICLSPRRGTPLPKQRQGNRALPAPGKTISLGLLASRQNESRDREHGFFQSAKANTSEFHADCSNSLDAQLPVQLTRVILLRTPFAADIRGHRQVVRHQLPKLTLAGSSPVARSMNERGPSNGALLCLDTLHGTPSTVGLLTIQRNIAGIRACQAGSRYH